MRTWSLSHRLQHPLPVDRVSWSPDGTRLITECSKGRWSNIDWYVTNGSVRYIWDVPTGQCMSTLAIEERSDFIWSPYGRFCAINEKESRVIVFDSVDGQLGCLSQHPAWGDEPIIWRPDNQAVAVRQKLDDSDDLRPFVQVFDLATGEELDVWPDVWNFGWSPDGSCWTVAWRDGRISVYDANGGAERFTVDGARTFNWSPDSSRLITEGERVELWDVNSGSLLALAPLQFGIDNLQWSKDGHRVVVNGPIDEDDWRAPQTFLVWDALSGTCLFSKTYEREGPSAVFDSTYMRPDGQQFAHFVCRCRSEYPETATSYDSESIINIIDDFIYVYDIDTGASHITSGVGVSLTWSNDSSLVARCANLDSPHRHEMKVLDVSTGNELFSLVSGRYEEQSADSTAVLLERPDKTAIEIRDSWSGVCEEVVMRPDWPSDADWGTDFEWSPVGTRAAIVQQGGFVEIWEPTQ